MPDKLDDCGCGTDDQPTIGCAIKEVEIPTSAWWLPRVPFRGMRAESTCPFCGVLSGTIHHRGCSGEHCPECANAMLASCPHGEKIRGVTTEPTHLPTSR